MILGRFRVRDNPSRSKKLSPHEQMEQLVSEIAQLDSQLKGLWVNSDYSFWLQQKRKEAATKLESLRFVWQDSARSDMHETGLRAINARNAEFWRPR